MDAWDAFARPRTTAFEGGPRLIPYRDTKNLWTVGVGHLLPQLGPIPRCITQKQSDVWFEEDWAGAIAAARDLVDFDALSDKRKAVFVDLCFNMGANRLHHFENMLAAVKRGDWPWAALELLDSDYAVQLHKRAISNARLLLAG